MVDDGWCSLVLSVLRMCGLGVDAGWFLVLLFAVGCACLA